VYLAPKLLIIDEFGVWTYGEIGPPLRPRLLQVERPAPKQVASVVNPSSYLDERAAAREP
jgi:hypothetical protein